MLARTVLGTPFPEELLRTRTAAVAVPALLLLLSSAADAASQSRPVVMIDPGHGGEQAGVRVGDLVEKDLVLRAAFALGESLVARVYDVRLTRTGDYTLPNPERRRAAEAAGAAAMISLHFNQNADSTRHGIEIYGNVEDAKVAALAERIASRLRTAGIPVTVAARANEFLTSPSVPTVMIEAGVLTHPVERRLATSPAYHQELARSLVAATADFLGGVP
jgi:N-acetylmuramoyl-L-alanine amidase